MVKTVLFSKLVAAGVVQEEVVEADLPLVYQHHLALEAQEVAAGDMVQGVALLVVADKPH